MKSQLTIIANGAVSRTYKEYCIGATRLNLHNPKVLRNLEKRIIDELNYEFCGLERFCSLLNDLRNINFILSFVRSNLFIFLCDYVQLLLRAFLLPTHSLFLSCNFP